jgi:hypothetical protein
MKTRIKKVILKFWKNIKKTNNCWIWTGKKDRDGYGLISIFNHTNNRIRGAHRLSYWIHNDYKNPKNNYICHTCDNPSCVNPIHLVLADVHWNNNDKIKKNRQKGPKGIQNFQAKFSDQDIIDIRNNPNHYEIISLKYNVHPETIRLIKKRKTWKHL